MSTKVPNWWMLWGVDARQQVINKLQDGCDLASMPTWWRFKPHEERVAVINQLHEQGSLTNAQTGRLFSTPNDRADLYRQITLAKKSAQLYRVGDKSKTRILPPVYHRLDRVWMRSNKTGIEPEVMNTGHLRNTILLLKESAANVQVKMEMFLGAMHSALSNQPHLQQQIYELFAGVNALDVDDLYPVFNVLQDEYGTRADMDAKDFVRRNGKFEQVVDGTEDFDQLDIDFNLKGW